MRELTVLVKKGEGEEVRQKAEELNGRNLSVEETHKGELVRVHLNNSLVSKFLERISHLEEAEITLNPRGVLTLYPPQDEAPKQVSDVTFRSPLEIYMAGLQSVGSKLGLVGYAISGGVLVWVGLYTNRSFLLVAAMLVAPFAGPAMNLALATAAGKSQLLIRSLGRYFLAIAVGIVVSFILSFLVGQNHATPLMVDISHISQVSLLLPLVAGFAGGINLVQSDRDSLVSGAAVGMLVAASLAPPVGLIGMALNFGNWQLIRSGIFLLILQLAGIQLAAGLIFRYIGKVTTHGVRFSDGQELVFKLGMFASVLVLGILLFWQFEGQPALQKASLATQITDSIRTELGDLKDIETIEVNARFTRGTLPDKNPVICEIYLYNRNAELTDQQVKKLVKDVLNARINGDKWNADLMYSITLLSHKESELAGDN